MQTGRSASRRLRRANQIPAVLYGKHTKPESLVVDTPEFVRLLKAVGGRAVLVELNREGHAEPALSFLQEIQRDPITDRYLHIDFQEVKAGEAIELDVPVRTTGESIGVKSQNGVLEVPTHALRVRCLPKNLPAVIEIDVSAMEVGDVIKVSDLNPIDGVEFLDLKGQPVVAVVQPVAEVASAIVTPDAGVPADGKAASAVDPKAAAAAPAKK